MADLLPLTWLVKRPPDVEVLEAVLEIADHSITIVRVIDAAEPIWCWTYCWHGRNPNHGSIAFPSRG